MKPFLLNRFVPILCLSASACITANAQTWVWDGPKDSTGDYNWSTDANWDPDGDPANSAATIISVSDDNGFDIKTDLAGISFGRINVAVSTSYSTFRTSNANPIALENPATPFIVDTTGSSGSSGWAPGGVLTSTGTNGIQKLGAGVLDFRWNSNIQTYQGLVDIQAGGVNITRNESLGNLDNDIRMGDAFLSHNGADLNYAHINLTSGRNIELTSGNSRIVTGGVIGTTPRTMNIQGLISGVGGLVKEGENRLTLSGANTYTGLLAGTGTLGTSVKAGELFLASGSSVSHSATELRLGTLNNINARMTVSSDASATVKWVRLGLNAGTNTALHNLGTLTVSGGASVSNFALGQNATSYGYYRHQTTTATTANEVGIGADAGGHGIMDINQGEFTANTYLILGRGNVTQQSELNVTGGTLKMPSSNANVAMFWQANTAGTSVINVGGTGLLTSLGTATELDLNKASTQATTVGVLNLGTGGTVQITRIKATKTEGTTLVNFHGGTLKANNTATILGGSNVDAACIWPEGALIDTNAKIATLSQNLQAPTGQGFSGITLSTNGTGYIGRLIVRISGDGTGATAVANYDPDTGTVNGITITNPGTGYTNATVSFTGGGGTAPTVESVGLSDNTSGGLAVSGTGTLVLSGNNTYTGGTTQNAGILQLGHNSALGTGNFRNLAVSSGRVVVNNGLNIANNISLESTVGFNSQGSISNNADAGNATVSGPISVTARVGAGGHFAGTGATGTLTLSGPITASTGVEIVQRLGTVIYSGSGSSFANFLLNVGTARLGADNGLATNAAVKIGELSSGSSTAYLDLAGYDQSLVGITKGNQGAVVGNSSTTSDSTLTIIGTSVYGGILQDAIGAGDHKLSLVKSVSGALDLTGTASTFTGGITVILSSQHPEYGTVTYFHGLIGGSKKGFSPGHVSFACCHGSGLENHAKYGDSIYFHHGGSELYVNLFISSELKWKDVGLTIRQNTRFPEEQESTITISTPKPVRTALLIRKPFWAGKGFAITINGEAVTTTSGANGYVRLDREWRDKDVIGVKLPMEFRWEAFKDNPNRAAMMYGPVLLVAETAEARRMATVAAPRNKALATLKPLDKPLRFSGDDSLFRLDLTPQPVRFEPLYQNSGRNFYSTYWDQETDVQRAASNKAYQTEVNRWKQLTPQTTDIAYHQMNTPAASNNLPGRLAADSALPRTAGADRTEQDHDVEAQQGYNHEFNLIARPVAGLWQTFRTIELGMDRFGWTLAAEPGKNHILLVRLWNPPANDPEARRATQCGFDVRAAAVDAPIRAADDAKPGTEGNQLATGGKAAEMPAMKSIGVIGPAKADGSFREISIPIPAELLGNKERLAVRFFRQRDSVPGLVGEVRLLRESAH